MSWLGVIRCRTIWDLSWKSTAETWLKEIVADYPETKAAEEAKKLLAE